MHERVLVCVTGQKTCKRLIDHGKELAEAAEDAEITVVHVAHTGQDIMGNSNVGEALEYLYTASRDAGADMVMLRSDDTLDTLAGYIKKNNITQVVMGTSSESDDFPKKLGKKAQGVQIVTIPAE